MNAIISHQKQIQPSQRSQDPRQIQVGGNTVRGGSEGQNGNYAQDNISPNRNARLQTIDLSLAAKGS